ncbi:MAG: sensor histidine kinase [Agriterribacter sp.]
MSIPAATIPVAYPDRSVRLRYALLHSVYWVLITAFFIYDKKYMIVKAGLPSFAACVTIRIALLIAIAYINVHYLLPRYLLKGKYWQYFLWVLLSVAGYLLVQALFDIVLYGYILGPMRRIHFWETISYNFFSTLWYIGVVIAFKLSIDWYEQKRILQRTAFEKLQAEVNYLRSQVNPHFLFNALNNLYSLTLKKSDAAPDVVLKLSGMMEYMLYDSDDVAVPLEREIQYLQDYVALEKLRYGEQADIQFVTEGDMAGLTIAPLLLLPMVENAFKHGASRTASATWLHCTVKTAGKELFVTVENGKQKEPGTVSKGGIGLLNLTRRLELLYAGRYDLDIRNREDRFFISLHLQLS